METEPAAPLAARTLAVFHLAETSGPSLSLEAELESLARSGSLHVLVPGPGRVAERYADFADVEVAPYSALTLPRGPAGAVQLAGRVRREMRMFRARLRELRPQRVVAVTTMLPALLLAARAEGVPVLVYAAEMVPRGPGAGRRAGGAVALGTTRRLAGAIACCSDAVAAQFAAPGAPPTITVHPPIRPPDGGDREGFRRRHGIDSDAPCVAVIGSISHGRGQDVLLRALPRLRERFPDMRVLLVGEPHPRSADAAYRDELRSLAAGLGVTGALVWTGFVERLSDVYAAADAVASPARREAFGRVAAEALLAGRPVVAARVQAVPEVLRDGVDALLVPPDDPDALATALERVLDDRELSDRLVRNGADRVAREFSPERSLERFAAAVDALGAGGDGSVARAPAPRASRGDRAQR